MLQLTVTTVLTAVEGGHAVAEEAIRPEVWGAGVFAVLIGLMIVAFSYSHRGLSPEVGEHEDPADLPADERALIDDYDAKRHG